VKVEDTSTSLELFETSNTPAEPTQPRKVETCSTGSATSSSKPRRLPRRWMPTMSPRTRTNPTLGMTLTWEMKNSAEADRMAADLEETMRAAMRCAIGLPLWRVHWQISRDPKAKYRLGLLLWMEPEEATPF